MKTAAVLALFLASAAAFTAPQFATRAVGPKKAVKKAVVKKAVVKKAVVKKVVKKVARKAPVAAATKAPPASKGYYTIAGADTFRLGKGKISGGGNKSIAAPVFVHPTINNEPAPSFDYKEAAKSRVTPQTAEFTFDDGLTLLERKQRSSLPAFLTGSAKSSAITSDVRSDIELQDYPFGLTGDRFQLLFISFFGIFALVGCLSGAVSLD